MKKINKKRNLLSSKKQAPKGAEKDITKNIEDAFMIE